MAAEKDAVQGRAPIDTSPVGAGSILEMLAGLVLVVLLIFALAWFVRRFGRVGHFSPGALRVLGALSLGPRERVVLMQVGEQQILLGVAPGRVQTLHVLDKPVSLDESEPTPFSQRLRQAMKREAAS